MLYGNLSEKPPRFFMNLIEYGHILYVSISPYKLLGRMRWSLGPKRTHVHSEEERPNRKIQTFLASSEIQYTGNIKSCRF